ncbi:hypothetical protein PHYSODRAFT_476314, partial [Phytophthora sojae]
EATQLDTVQDIISELEKRAIGAGTVTYDGLNDAIRACLRDTEAERQMCHFWGGKFRRVSAEFGIPDCSVRHAWVLWMCGNKAKQIPPLRLLDGRDMPSRMLQKPLSQLRFLMRKIENDEHLKICFNLASPSTQRLNWATVEKLLRKKAKRTVN